MTDLIERQAAIDAIRSLYILIPKKNNDFAYDMAIDQAYDMVEDLPSAEPERKTGKWLIEYHDSILGRRAEIKYCSECRQVSPFRHKFCPNCGADMRGEDHEND